MMESSSRNSPPPCTMTFFHRGCGAPNGWYARYVSFRTLTLKSSRLMFSSLSQSNRSSALSVHA